MVNSTLTIQDLLLYGSIKSSAKKIDRDVVLPYFIVPGSLLIASKSYTATIIILVVIGMGALYVHTRPKQKNRSLFFFSWILASGISMFLIFEFCIIWYNEVTQLEHIILLLLVALTCYFFNKMKSIADFELATGSSKGKEYSPVLTSDSQYCQICQIEVNERFFHSIWWDCCVLRPNYIYFLAGQIFALATLLFGTNLSITTLCQPYVLYGDILMPLHCGDLYFDLKSALSFASCAYGLGYLLVIVLVLIRQILIYIPKYCEPQWRKLVHNV